MKIISLFVALILSQQCLAIMVCLAPIDDAMKGPRSLSNPTGRDMPYNFKVLLGEKVFYQNNNDVQCVGYFNYDEFPVVIESGGLKVESFYINRNKYLEGACIWFKPLYDSWHVVSLENNIHPCHHRKKQVRAADS